MSLYSEDETRRKLRPFALSGNAMKHCAASDCMAWRFVGAAEAKASAQPRRGSCMPVYPPVTVRALRTCRRPYLRTLRVVGVLLRIELPQQLGNPVGDRLA
jgi:hypothetical protein